MVLPIITSRRGMVTNETKQRMLQRLPIILGSRRFMMVLLLCCFSAALIYPFQKHTTGDLLNALDDNKPPAPTGALNKNEQPGYHDDGIVLNGTKEVENTSLGSPSGGTETIEDTFKGDQFPSSINFVEPTKSFSATSTGVLVDDQKKFVLKRLHKGMRGYEPLGREVCVLSHLAPFPWSPKVAWHNSSALITSYVGEPLTVFNIPLDYREQYEKIVVDMESVGVNHGDIYKVCHGGNLTKCKVEKRRGLLKEDYELMVHHVNGKSHVSLVDFGWATVHGSYACDSQTMRNKAPAVYNPREDRSVHKRLDLTFRRHLQLEQHFMVDWTLHYTEKHIREVIKSWPNLLIRKMIQHPKITNDTDRVRTFSKFYNVHVDDFRGTTPFNMYFITDLNTTYNLRPSSKGKRLVNAAMFDFKKALRTAMGGGFKIHATDNIQETKENQVALGQPEEYQRREFDSLRRVFDVLDLSGIDYVVLRNFEKMPNEVKVDPNHLDVDLLVSDYYEAKRLLDGDNPPSMWNKAYENGHYRVVNRVIIEGKQVDFDLRHVGDNYLDKQWQLDILKRREKWMDTGIFVPSEEDHLYSIIYHAIIQKPSISQTYVNVMKSLGKYTDAQARDKKFLRMRLDSFMKNHGYKMVKPMDVTVGYYSG